MKLKHKVDKCLFDVSVIRFNLAALTLFMVTLIFLVVKYGQIKEVYNRVCPKCLEIGIARTFAISFFILYLCGLIIMIFILLKGDRTTADPTLCEGTTVYDVFKGVIASLFALFVFGGLLIEGALHNTDFFVGISLILLLALLAFAVFDSLEI